MLPIGILTRRKKPCLNTGTQSPGPADPPTQTPATRSPSHPRFQPTFQTRLKASWPQQNHRKLDHQLVSKENKIVDVRKDDEDSVTITVKTNPLWIPSWSHPPSQSPSLMISWRRCSIAHPREPYPARRGQRWLVQTHRCFKIPPKIHPLAHLRKLWNRVEIKYSHPTSCRKREPDIPEAFSLSPLSLLASGTPTRSSQSPPHAGRDTGPLWQL